MPPLLELAHLTTYAAWLAHAPCTTRALAGKSERPLVELHPRTLELAALGALTIAGQTADGPVYTLAHAPDLNAPTPTDHLQRQLNTLSLPDQVSIAAAIMGRAARHRATRHRRGDTQPELAPTSEPTAPDSPLTGLPPLTPADAGRLL